MAFWDDYDELEEHANITMMEDTYFDSEFESADEEIEVFSDLPCSELINMLNKFVYRNCKVSPKHRSLRKARDIKRLIV